MIKQVLYIIFLVIGIVIYEDVTLFSEPWSYFSYRNYIHIHIHNEFIMDSLSLSSITSFVKSKACINAVALPR